MSVDVTLLPATIPPRLAEEDIDRIRRFEDRTAGEQLRFEYSVPPSGALVVWRLSDPNLTPEVEAVFGPAAWEEVQGDLHRPL
ncbi:hypothetical protein J7E88_27185 [Streptomyces sp. ISL-10]|uniref:hypothetical protein n=1 Tax=Streptomyces sp. ISL-10 TaxID=2819172 RepID=UPI001BEAF1FA|nr:hypothetical protein [Streptomyces sp. ISL-10]MBT2368901.1 hypothetical protein [Streptomyces sp. ISL-10]